MNKYEHENYGNSKGCIAIFVNVIIGVALLAVVLLILFIIYLINNP